MKKLFVMACTVGVFALMSCNGGKTAAPKANADSDSAVTDTAVKIAEATEVPATASQLVDQLNEKVKNKDQKGMAEVLTAAQTKIMDLAKSNPEEAKKYAEALQSWMKQNAETIKSAVAASGNEAAAKAVGAALDAMPAGDAQKPTAEQEQKVKDAAKQAAEKLKGQSAADVKKEAEKVIKDLGY